MSIIKINNVWEQLESARFNGKVFAISDNNFCSYINVECKCYCSFIKVIDTSVLDLMFFKLYVYNNMYLSTI